MNRKIYLNLAASGLRMPIGTDLVLHEKSDHQARLLDGEKLGQVVVESAHRYRTPLAFPLMDLRVEKEDLLLMLGVSAAQCDAYHFTQAPTDPQMASIRSKLEGPPTPRMRANLDSLRHVAGHKDLVAVGMTIGPFSLMTKLLADPITPVFLAGSGISGKEDPEVLLLERTLELATLIVERSIRFQVRAGAKAVCVCEPAANKVFLSPNQLAAGSDIFERMVMIPNRRIRQVLQELDADLIFHDCGELTEMMIRQFVTLDPAILSLGSSRKLWEDARLVPKTTVLYGNLPSKKFYSDAEITVEQVRTRSSELLRNMKTAGHPFVLGSECDVLSVPDCHSTIVAKVQAMLDCA